jgi:hypothetical protein
MPSMRIQVLSVISAALLAASLGGCVTAPRTREALVMPVPPGKARVYFYRDPDYYDGLEWTVLSLNGVRVGTVAPGTVFFRDIAPGRYRVDVRSDKLYPDQAKTISVAPGTTIFVRVEAQPFWGQTALLWQGNTFLVAIVAPTIGEYEISHLRLTSG